MIVGMTPITMMMMVIGTHCKRASREGTCKPFSSSAYRMAPLLSTSRKRKISAMRAESSADELMSHNASTIASTGPGCTSPCVSRIDLSSVALRSAWARHPATTSGLGTRTGADHVGERCANEKRGRTTLDELVEQHGDDDVEDDDGDDDDEGDEEEADAEGDILVVEVAHHAIDPVVE
eukprot:276653-Rhodomonas_salina.1